MLKAPQIPGFDVLEKLGQGAFGSVWKARDTSLPRHVAIKVLHQKWDTPEEDNRFFKEIAQLVNLERDGIVTVYSAATTKLVTAARLSSLSSLRANSSIATIEGM